MIFYILLFVFGYAFIGVCSLFLCAYLSQFVEGEEHTSITLIEIIGCMVVGPLFLIQAAIYFFKLPFWEKEVLNLKVKK